MKSHNKREKVPQPKKPEVPDIDIPKTTSTRPKEPAPAMQGKTFAAISTRSSHSANTQHVIK